MRGGVSLVWACCAAAGAAGCSANNFMTRLTLAPSPHERYADALEAANLHETALGRDWVRAGEASVAQALAVSLPFREAGYFPLDEASAAAYRLELSRGRRLVVEVTFDSVQPGQLFVDLFDLRPGESPDRVASIGEGTTLVYDVPRDGTYVLRIQPELLRSGRYTVVERTLASLIFPVSGLTARDLQSEFGAARDAGRREHEGIDIFAARGTPVIAVADGRAEISTNALGGNVVWLRNGRTGRTFYYAHLDRGAFDGAATVRAGDVVGYVGNTGNARTTSPHLHFGIYEGDAIDPFPFLQIDDPIPAPLKDSLDRLGARVRVTAARTALREGAGRTAQARRLLDRASIAEVLGISQSVIRVSLPDGTTGYIDEGTAVQARSAIRQHRLAAGSILRERPVADAPVVDVLASDVQVDVLGRFGRFELVRLASAKSAWVETDTN